MSDRIARRVVVHGTVQGVGFRYAMRREAERAGVNGWVRNRRDGTVEAVVEGPAAGVEAVIAWAGHGPASAQVTSVEVEPAEGRFEGFEHRPSE